MLTRAKPARPRPRPEASRPIPRPRPQSPRPRPGFSRLVWRPRLLSSSRCYNKNSSGDEIANVLVNDDIAHT